MDSQGGSLNVKRVRDIEDIFIAGNRFKELEEWSSLVALSVIAMVDEEYDVEFRGDDIRDSKTVEDLYNAVVRRMEEEEEE